MTDARFLILSEESGFGKALDLVLPAIALKIDPDIEDKAKQQATDCLRRLQSFGYYGGRAIIVALDELLPGPERPSFGGLSEACR